MYNKNTYWVLRHGRSKANEAGIIVSSLDNGVKADYGLAEAGYAQAAAAGALLQQQLSQAGVALSSVLIFSSPFSRTLETGQAAAAAAGINAGDCMQVTPLLAERFFGSALELTSHDNYCPFWASDAQDPNSRPVGSEDGESVVQVSQRVHQLFQVCRDPDTKRSALITSLQFVQSDKDLERQHKGQQILLVSHGDTLSILQATFHGTPLTEHRQYGLATAELKCLNPTTTTQQGLVSTDGSGAGQAGVGSSSSGSRELAGASLLR